MREIEFRGRRLNGKWVQGYLYGKNAIIDVTSEYLFTSMGTVVMGINQVDPSTVGQYTGLRDSKRTEEYPKGQKIYEGDIVECVYDGILNVYQVVYDLSELDFKATNGKENYRNNFQYLTCCDEVMVIGNVYEDGDRLGGAVNG